MSDGHVLLHLKKFHQVRKVYLWLQTIFFVENDPRIPYMSLDLKSNNGKGVNKLAGHLSVQTDIQTPIFII